MTIFYLFIDGIGFGKNSKSNPFASHARSFLAALADRSGERLPAGWVIHKLNAHMGISGLPQSATGQTALWTGLNAARIMGHHKTGFPGPTLIRIIKEHSIIKRFNDAGSQTMLLNAYSQKYLDRIAIKPRLMSASTHVHLSGGNPLNSLEALKAGKAIYMDITHEIMHAFFKDLAPHFPLRDPFERGQETVAMATDHGLVIFEYFITDKLGHDQNWKQAGRVISNLEQFIAGIASAMKATDTLFITSDHGNFEDMTTGSHTHNPVPLFALGHRAQAALDLKFLYEIPDLILDIAGIAA